MRFIIYRDPVGQWRWTFEANGRPLAQGGGAHPTPARCLEDIAQIRAAHLSPVSVSPFPRSLNSEAIDTSRPLREPATRADPSFDGALETRHASG